MLYKENGKIKTFSIPDLEKVYTLKVVKVNDVLRLEVKPVPTNELHIRLIRLFRDEIISYLEEQERLNGIHLINPNESDGRDYASGPLAAYYESKFDRNAYNKETFNLKPFKHKLPTDIVNLYDVAPWLAVPSRFLDEMEYFLKLLNKQGDAGIEARRYFMSRAFNR